MAKKKKNGKRYSEHLIVSILKELEKGKTITELSRTYGVSDRMICTWQRKYEGMQVSDIREMKQLKTTIARAFLSIILIIISVLLWLFFIHTDITKYFWDGSVTQIRIEADLAFWLLFILIPFVAFFLYLVYRVYGRPSLIIAIVAIIILSLSLRPGLRGIFFRCHNNERPYDSLVYYDYYLSDIYEYDDFHEIYAEHLLEFSIKESMLEEWLNSKHKVAAEVARQSREEALEKFYEKQGN